MAPNLAPNLAPSLTQPVGNKPMGNLEGNSEIPPSASEDDPQKSAPNSLIQEALGDGFSGGGRGTLMVNPSRNPSLRPEDARSLFAQLVEERDLLKQQIALLEEKLAQQNEMLKAVYRERDEFRERLRWEQRHSNQLKRALESMVERTAETRPVAPVGVLDLMPKEPPRTSEPAPHREGWFPRPEDRASEPRTADLKDPAKDLIERSPQNETQEVTDAEPVLALQTEGSAPIPNPSVPNNVVLLRPLAEPTPLSPPAPRGEPSSPVALKHSAATAAATAETVPAASDTELQKFPPEPVSAAGLGMEGKDPGQVLQGREEGVRAIAATAAPPLRKEVCKEVKEVSVPASVPASVPGSEPVKPPRPRPMLPAFASRSQPAGAKFLSENSPVEREVNRRRGERPEVDCSERPERPVGVQVAPPSFWQDLQKGTPPKGNPPPPRKRVTAFAAIQLPDFPPLR